MKKLLAFAFAAVFTPTIYGQDINSGNFVKSLCDDKDLTLSCTTFVAGLIQGIESQASWTRVAPGFCVPERVTYGQRVGVFQKYLNDHPEQLHLRAGELFYLSQKIAFPCR